jgi:hypothetical protein
MAADLVIHVARHDDLETIAALPEAASPAALRALLDAQDTLVLWACAAGRATGLVAVSVETGRAHVRTLVADDDAVEAALLHEAIGAIEHRDVPEVTLPDGADRPTGELMAELRERLAGD